MCRPTIGSLPLVAALLAACTANAEERMVSPDVHSDGIVITPGCHLEFETDANEPAIPSWLQAEGLAYGLAEQGQALPLNTLIVMPSPTVDDEALLIIEFPREDLNEAFIRSYFFDRQALIPVVHPYSRMGVEYILTEERLILKIHPDMVVHLRDDYTGTVLDVEVDRPDYQRRMFTSPDIRDVFRRDDAVATVIFVSGDVYVSDDPERVRSDFHHLHTGLRIRAPGESIPMVCRPSSPDDRRDPPRLFPESYPPRVVAGR